MIEMKKDGVSLTGCWQLVCGRRENCGEILGDAHRPISSGIQTAMEMCDIRLTDLLNPFIAQSLFLILTIPFVLWSEMLFDPSTAE